LRRPLEAERTLVSKQQENREAIDDFPDMSLIESLAATSIA
jgi:hypothetical protein